MALNHVLLVDDEQDAILGPFVTAFEEGGIHIDTANTWDRAVEQFMIKGHSLVIADWNLPGSRNGLILLARLKRLRPGTRLVLFSGFLDEAQRTSVLALPFVDAALAKGVDLFEALFSEAQAAVERASTPLNWASLAGEYRAAVETNLDDVAAFEAKLRTGAS